MSIQTKIVDGIVCGKCHKTISGMMPVDILPGSEYKNALPAALAYKCQHCEIYLCKECYKEEKESLKGVNKIRGINCPVCASKFDQSGICLYPQDLNLDAAVAGILFGKEAQISNHTENTTGIKCEECAKPLEGQLTTGHLQTREGALAFPAAIGIKCLYCSTFLCKECYSKAKQGLEGLTKFAGIIDCPCCGMQFSSPFVSNQGIFPPTINLTKLEEFDQLMKDLFDGPDSNSADSAESMLLRIKEHSDLLLAHINDQISSRINAGLLLKLVTLGRLGADWLLNEDALSDEVVGKILEISQSKGKMHTIKPGVMVDIKNIASQALIEIEIARKDGSLIPYLIEAEMVKDYPLPMARITWNEQIVDKLIDELNNKWEIRDPGETNLFKESYVPARAQIVAIGLITYGNERGARAALQRFYDHVKTIPQGLLNTTRYDESLAWCKKYGSNVTPIFIEGLDNEDPRIRLYVIEVLEQIGDHNTIPVLSDLEKDSDDRVRHRSQIAVKRLKEKNQKRSNTGKLLDPAE